MNSCILMAQIVSNPELRSTQDNVSVASMMVEFESTREGDAPGKVQVEGWGNLAEEIKNTYSAGEQIIIEGRLSMNLFEMPEGYKEKRAKLVASRIYPVGGSMSNSDRSSNADNSSNVVEFAASSQSRSEPAYSDNDNTIATSESAVPTNTGNEDWDEIPF